MKKIPKNLSDKDMFQGYVEEKSIESHFLDVEATKTIEDKARRTKALGAKKGNSKLAGLSDELIARLDGVLLQLKLDLFKDGVKDYTMKLTREGNRIILEPKIIK